MKRKFLLTLLLLMPITVMANDEPYKMNDLVNQIKNASDIEGASKEYEAAFKKISNAYSNSVDKSVIDSESQKMKDAIKNALNPGTNSSVDGGDKGNETKTDDRDKDEKEKALEEKTKAYEDAKANEQSMANKLLSATSMAASGIGGMELARGLSEQSADKQAAQDMSAYISTMRCTYGEGVSVNAGPDEIELPGGNDENLMKYRSEYFALANSLKERKNALGLQPGIESEEILDKAQMGLYDDESTGITNGAYESLYRAQMLNSEKDQAAINEAADASKKRVLGGAIAAGAGVVVGVVGNSLINGKLGELIKKNKNCKEIEKIYDKETKALDNLKSCLDKAGAIETDSLSFNSFQANWLSLTLVKCRELLQKAGDKPIAKSLFEDSNSVDAVPEIVKKLKESFGEDNVKKMLGAKGTNDDDLQSALTSKIEKLAKDYEDAIEKDEKKGCDSNFLDGLKQGIADAKTNLEN